MTFPPGLALSGSGDLSHAALQELKHLVIGNPARKLEVLRDPALVEQLVTLCRAAREESQVDQARRLEAVIVVGSLSHAGKQAIPNLLVLPALLPNLLSSLVAAAPPSPSQPAPDAVRLKALTAALQSLANAVGAMGRWIEKERWGAGLAEDDAEEVDARTVRERDAEWRAAVGQRIGEFLEGSTPTLLFSLLPSSPGQAAAPLLLPPSSLPTRTLLPLLTLLTNLASFSPETRGALLAAPPPGASASKGKGRSADGAMDTDDADGEGEGWAEQRVSGTVQAFLTAGQRGAKGDHSKATRAALELLATLALNSSAGNKTVHWAVLDALDDPDAGVSFGGAHAFANLAADSDNQWPTDHCAQFFTALLALWADIPVPSSLASTAAAGPSSITKPDEQLAPAPGKELSEVQIRAVFLLARAITPRLQAQTLMIEMGLVRRLGELLALGSGDDVEWRETHGAPVGAAPALALGLEAAVDVGEVDLGETDRHGHARLREGVLLVLASVALTSTQHHATLLLVSALIRTTLASLGHPTPAVRAAACQLVRGLSRNVSVLRETLVDSGVGERLVGLILHPRAQDAKEDDGVLSGALAAVANLLLELSPLKESLVQSPVLGRIAEFAAERAPSPFQQPWSARVRLNALWALKNFAYRASSQHRLHLVDALISAAFDCQRLVDAARDDDDALARTVELFSLLNNLWIGADDNVRGLLVVLCPFEAQQQLIRDVVASRPQASATHQAAVGEALNLLWSVHHARRPEADNPASVSSTLERVRLAAAALEHDSVSLRLASAEVLDDMFQDLLKADPEAIQHLYDIGLNDRVAVLLADVPPTASAPDRADAPAKKLEHALRLLAADFAGWELKRETMLVDDGL